jgi:hypothetical protein
MALNHAQPDEIPSEILGRRRNEKPYLLIPVGYPAPDAAVPAMSENRLTRFV